MAHISIKLRQANMSQFQPLKLEPGSQMKPKSKMNLQLKDDVDSQIDLNQFTPAKSRLANAKRLSSLMENKHLMIDESDQTGFRGWEASQVKRVPLGLTPTCSVLQEHPQLVVNNSSKGMFTKYGSTRDKFNRSSEISNSKGQINQKFQNQTSRDSILKITGSPLNAQGNNTMHKYKKSEIKIPPIKNPSPTYAYQVSASTVQQAADHSHSHHHGVAGSHADKSPASPRKNPKVVVANQRGAIHQSASRDVLNDDMREVFSAGSNLA